MAFTPPQIWVEIDGRKFRVTFDANGQPWRIYERKTYGTPPISGVHDASYWHADHHSASPGTMAARIIEAAKVKNA